MPPRRREQSRGDPDDPGPSGQGGGGGGGGGGAGAAAVQPVHRFAFVQHLMKNGCMTEDAAKEVVQRLTGSGSGELCYCPMQQGGRSHAGRAPRGERCARRQTRRVPHPPRDCSCGMPALCTLLPMQTTRTGGCCLTRTARWRPSTCASRR